MPAKVTSKGQITLPKWVRESLGLNPGASVEFILREGHIHLLKTSGSVSEALAGSLRRYAGKRDPASERAMMERVRNEVAHAAAAEGRPRRHQRSS